MGNKLPILRNPLYVYMNARFIKLGFIGLLVAGTVVLLFFAVLVLAPSEVETHYDFLVGREPIEITREGGHWRSANTRITRYYSFSADPNAVLSVAHEELSNKGYQFHRRRGASYIDAYKTPPNHRRWIWVYPNREPVFDPTWRTLPSLSPKEGWVYVRVVDQVPRPMWRIKIERWIK